ncbi:MAG TPA: triose-phosphate isomerase [Flavobacteriales bacterium]|nr:triose-phosphate isomerase [Flavobacteriales bacterium]
MKTIVAGNWKMHKDLGEARALAAMLADWVKAHPGEVEVVIAPPFPFLAAAVEAVKGTSIRVAAQNCHEADQGAFTGEVSAAMLSSLGVSACIVGHSERRQYFGENDPAVGRKIAALLKHGVLPLYCCGEVRAEREEGRHFDVVARQLHTALSALPKADIGRIVVAYEPVWAIGTGLTATAEQAQEMHAFIRKELHKLAGDHAEEVPILYGGSCKPDNAAGLFAGEDVNGGLIGGASLLADQFTALVEIAERSIAVA